jgi:hypothetical protein
MANYEMTCTCGDKMQMEGDSAEDAVDKLMVVMTPEAVTAHMNEKHPGDAAPSAEQTRAGFMATATAI